MLSIRDDGLAIVLHQPPPPQGSECSWTSSPPFSVLPSFVLSSWQKLKSFQCGICTCTTVPQRCSWFLPLNSWGTSGVALISTNMLQAPNSNSVSTMQLWSHVGSQRKTLKFVHISTPDKKHNIPSVRGSKAR